MNLEVVLPIEAHIRQIMEWRNDPETLKASYHQEPAIWDTFLPDFLDDAFCFPHLPPLFALQEGKRVAFLRFDPVEHPTDSTRSCCEVSINVAPECRGKGVGYQSLKIAKTWIKNQGYDDLYAEVKTENRVSQHLFEKAGYQKVDEAMKWIEDIDLRIPIIRYLCPLTPKKEKKPVFVIAEAGSNWCVGSKEERYALALQLIEAAKNAGADAVKFQVFRPETIYVENAGSSDYLSDAGIQEDIRKIFENLLMPYEWIPKLSKHCNDQGIEFMASAFSKEDFEAVDPYVKRHKIASYEIGHIHLIHLAAAAQKPLIMSTGAATEFEIAWAVDTFRNFGGSQLTLLQCSAQYPAVIDDLNLRTIPWLKQRFGVPAGLSDHSAHPLYAPIAAVALGASVVEKHFTLDRTFPGPDHAFAIEADELKEMVTAIRAAEKMRGSGIKRPQDSEQELREYARRGVQALKDISTGEVFREGENIALLRPGKQPLGVHARYLQELEGKSAKQSISLGQGIQKGDW